MRQVAVLLRFIVPLLLLVPAVEPVQACNARQADSIHAHSHLAPAKRAFTVGKSEFGLTECRGGQAGIYPCRGVDLLAFVPLGEMGGTTQTTANDVWGWTDPVTEKEYAIVAHSDGVAFLDISDPQRPRYLGKLPTNTIATGWRDTKVYRDHAFVVADAAQQHGVQVFDLKRLRGQTSAKTWNADTVYGRLGSSHNIAINETTGFAYAVGSDTCEGGLHMIDIRAPKNPTFAGCFDADGYTHDVQCVIYRGADADYFNREVCFASNEDTLTVVDVQNKSAPRMVSRIGYGGSGYTHQAWLTENHRFLLMDDEADERQQGHRTRTYVWDVRDLDAPKLIGRYNASTGSIDHNLYIRGDHAFQANYLAGLRILDLDRVGQGKLTEIAYFDVAPGRDSTGFSGSWSVYPFFESGVVLLTDISQGVFLLRPDVLPAPVEVATVSAQPAQANGSPNPGGALLAGRPIRFEVPFTGPGIEASWTFGDDGMALPAGPCDAQEFCATHIFPEAGSYSVRVAVRGDKGQLAEATKQVQVIDGELSQLSEAAFLQSVILGPRGNTGTFRSNVWVHNAGKLAASVDFIFLPRGIGSAEAVLKRLTILPDATLFVPDVLNSVFGIDNGQGSILLNYRAELIGGDAESGPHLAAISRSFVEAAEVEGSFGQLVAEDRVFSFNAESKTTAGILEGDGFITTLLAANLDGSQGLVTVELFDAAGVQVGSEQNLPLGPGVSRIRRLLQLFPEVVDHQGPFTARFRSNGIAFAASATLLEAESEDQVFVPASEPTSDSVLYLPRVVRATGQFDVQLSSWLVVVNESTDATQLIGELLLRGANNSDPQRATRTLAAGETLVLQDVIQDLFGLDVATGALRVNWSNADGVAPRLLSYGFARTPTPEGAADGEAGARFGMRIGTLTAADAIATEGVQFAAEQSDLFRSSYGAVNLHDRGTVLSLELVDGAGAVLRQAEVNLRPFQHLERNFAGIFDSLGNGSNWTVRTTVISGGPVLTYLANINASGDVFFVPGAPQPGAP